MTGIPLIITFVIAVVLMILGISKLKIHPFLAIMGISIILALVVGIPMTDVPGVIGGGFSGIFKSIGIVIILGVLIGTILEKTGAAIKLADMIANLVGEKHPELAIMIMGWIVSIPVFCDSGFVILNPIRSALVKKTKTSSVAMTVALSAGLYTAHVFIPPTPGPIAAAGSLGVDGSLLMVILFGAIVSIPALAAALWFAKRVGKRVKSREDIEDNQATQTYEEIKAGYGDLPSGWDSLSPILMPIVFMALGSISKMANWGGFFGRLFVFLGNPLMALIIGLLFAVVLLVKTHALDRFNEVTNDSLKIVGPILFITAAGSALGAVIKATTFVSWMQSNAGNIATIGILFPFIIAAILKSAQGSSTVAIVTTAGILGVYSDPNSMMNVLGLNTPMLAVLAVLAIGAGAMTVSHANDSYFWVVTNLGELEPEQGYKTQTAMTAIMGVVSMLTIFILSLFF